MSKITEKVAYLDGLMDGMELPDDKYKKLFSAIVDTLKEVAEELADHEDILADLDDNVDDILDELEEHEEAIFGDEDDEDDDDDDDEDDDGFFEIVCPSCGETIYFDEDMLDRPDGLICPNCNEPIDITISLGDCDDDEDETPEA